MKKILAAIFCTMIIVPAAFGQWTQLAPGMYMDNLNVSGNNITVSYKYTSEFQGFKQELQKYNIDPNTIGSFSLDVFVDCAGKEFKISNMKIYAPDGSLVFSDNNVHRNPNDAKMNSVCTAATQGTAFR